MGKLPSPHQSGCTAHALWSLEGVGIKDLGPLPGQALPIFIFPPLVPSFLDLLILGGEQRSSLHVCLSQGRLVGEGGGNLEDTFTHSDSVPRTFLSGFTLAPRPPQSQQNEQGLRLGLPQQ